jgi:hypothetical protein
LRRVDEIPDFIDLDALARQVAKHPILISGASAASVDDELGHGVLAGPGQPGDSTDGLPLAKQMEDAGAVFLGQPVHADHYV